jgi:hypothetical protein
MVTELKAYFDKIKERSWKTSLLGIALMVAGIVTVFLGKASWPEAMFAVLAGAALVFSKDSDKK